MGTYKTGILGSFQGTVGTVTGATWKGIEYMKSRNSKSSKPATERQLLQRAKFTFVIKFVSSIGKLLMVTFKEPAMQMTGINSAFIYNYNNALTGSYPSFALDYRRVLVSKGQLHNVINPVATATANGEIKMEWGDNSGIAMANATDKCIMVAYCPELRQSVYKAAGAERNAKTDSLHVAGFNGHVVETWISFITADGTEVASSFYTGRVMV